MRLEEVSTPRPGPGEVLIRVHAVSVNRTLDLAVRAGRYPAAVALPHVLGVDPSGVVAALGLGVTGRQIGERVVAREVRRADAVSGTPMLLGVHAWGGYAEYVTVPAAMAHAIPDGLDFATATVVARHAPTALSMLRDYAQLQPGAWVLVMGASGGLGSAGVQVARGMGAKVIAAAGASARVKAAVDLGADAGVDYRSENLTDAVLQITGGRGVEVVFENIADPDLFPRAFAALAPGGRLVTAGAHGGGTVPLDVQRLYLKGITVIGSVGRASAADVARCLEAAAGERHRVLIDRVMPLAEAALAHRIVGERSGTGKVVLRPSRVEAT
jgi:NADPH:quinone reductase-like Zn-dependent oxidoreductase